MSSEKNSKNHLNLDSNEKQEKISMLHLGIILLCIMISGLILRIYYLPIEVPITLDGLFYFWYANDISLLKALPIDYSPANIGWPIFLSFFFTILDSNNFMDYMALQRLVTSVLSILTVFPIYLLCRKFFSEKLSLIGAAIFVFEPRIIQNSIFGITEPLFILLVATSTVCLLNKQKLIIFVSFILIAFATIVRAEGIILIIPFSIIYILRFRNSKKIIYETPLLILIFILIIIPVSMYKIDVLGNDLIFSRIPNIDSDINKSPEMQKNPETLKEIRNVFMMVGWASIPIFVFFIPYGIFKMFKERKMENVSILTILFFLSIPAIYAISFLPDTRYLLILYPILSVISLFSVRKYFNKFSHKNIGLVILISLILVSSVIFLEIKKIDVNHENESLKIAKIISEKTEIINQYTTESGYLPIIGMQELEKFPILRNDFMKINNDLKHCLNIHACNNIISVKSNDIVEFLQDSEEKGITHLVIDNKEQRRVSFVNEIFKNEDQFPYLTKIYDSKNDQFSYQIKIFEIDFEKFNSLN